MKNHESKQQWNGNSNQFTLQMGRVDDEPLRQVCRRNQVTGRGIELNCALSDWSTESVRVEQPFNRG
jgi:hypothetical protein